MKTFFLLSCTVLTLGSCFKKEPTASVTIPQGFKPYTAVQKPNGKPNLFFFEYHHCPSCDLVRNHLINSKGFQKATASFNRYQVELGTPFGKEIGEKYDISVSSMFLITDPHFKALTKSTYGILSLKDFQEWLDTKGNSSPPQELEILTHLKNKYPALKDHPAPGLSQLFSSLANDIVAFSIADFITDADQQVSRWSQQNIPPSEAFSRGYRLGLANFSLGMLAHKYKSKGSAVFFENSISNFKKITSGKINSDFGRYLYQLKAHIMLEETQEIEDIVTQLEKGKVNDISRLYMSLATNYYFYKKDCKSAMTYANKIKLKDILVEGDRVSHFFVKAHCYHKSKDLKAFQNEYNQLLKLVSPSLKKAYEKTFAQIDGLHNELKKNRSNSPASS